MSFRQSKVGELTTATEWDLLGGNHCRELARNAAFNRSHSRRLQAILRRDPRNESARRVLQTETKMVPI